MATVSFIEKIEQRLTQLLSNTKLVRLTNQDDATASTVNAVTLTQTATIAASRVKAYLGAPGDYDDADDTVGDPVSLELAARYGMLNLSQQNTITMTTAGDVYTKQVMADLESEQLARERGVGAMLGRRKQ